jgi:hypothetical protein
MATRNRGLIRSVDVFGVTRPLDRLFEDIRKAIISEFHIMATEAAIREVQKNRGKYDNAIAGVLEKRKKDITGVLDRSIEIAKKSGYAEIAEELERRKDAVDFVIKIMKDTEINDAVTDILVDVLKTARAKMG